MNTKLGSGLPFTVESGNDNNGDGQTNDRLIWLAIPTLIQTGRAPRSSSDGSILMLSSKIVWAGTARRAGTF